MKKTIALISGDGIGPEIIEQAKKVLCAVAEKYSHEFSFVPVLAGGKSIDKFGSPLTSENLEKCLSSDAVLLGSVGGPEWDNVPPQIRPEKALLGLRSGLECFANLRPAKVFPQLSSACPLKDSILQGNIDLLIVRELTGGIYFGKSGISEDGLSAFDTEFYSTLEIERILRVSLECAMKRRKKLCLVDKANVLQSSRLWRTVALKMASDFPSVELSFMYVDNAAMQLIHNPCQFDVIVTSNMFGDILSDEASQLTGSIGMLPSASLGNGSKPFLYEPIHGSAPDIAGKEIANPLATLLSCSLLLRYSFSLEDEACAIEKAVDEVLNEGYRTFDIKTQNENEILVNTSKMGDLVADKIRKTKIFSQ